MADTYMVLISMRKSFSFLWDEYGFKLVGLMPKSGYRDSGYFVQLENEWCLLAFQSESGFLEDIGVVPKGGSSEGEFVSRWALLSAGEEEKPLQLPYRVSRQLNVVRMSIVERVVVRPWRVCRAVLAVSKGVAEL